MTTPRPNPFRINGTAAQKQPTNREKLLIALEQARIDIETARCNFDFAGEPDLIEACAYEIKANEARYRHILNRIRGLMDEYDATEFEDGF